ncbi:hypothetical protein LEP1GSC036_4009 [Leptospira weilii str. 2006001853]|uniref:Uncharacterized protein n=1 Tax=Leptospira weilii str. 2006001853 TaxID=1001589 RepID=A0A828Z3S7_9LEPT|nr:hypothetical protein LEP1GSC036_4009 [Leptospira weilii str. 2006001853]
MNDVLYNKTFQFRFLNRFFTVIKNGRKKIKNKTDTILYIWTILGQWFE